MANPVVLNNRPTDPAANHNGNDGMAVLAGTEETLAQASTVSVIFKANPRL